jgi:hypothetical protein
MQILNNGSYETFKAGLHATALGLAGVMGLYNAAAWLQRREPHLAINTVLYAALMAWEQQHVAHHLRSRSPAADLTPEKSSDVETAKMPTEVAAA